MALSVYEKLICKKHANDFKAFLKKTLRYFKTDRCKYL